jgi:tetratricopeptide (TPR) repeat protein
MRVVTTIIAGVRVDMSRHPFRGLLALVLLIAPLAADADAGRLPQAAPPAAAPAAIQARLDRVRADVFAGGARLPAAISELQQILAIDPRSPEAHMLLGLAHAGEGSRDMLGEAVAELRQALAIEPRLLPARFYLAKVYLDLAQPDRARDELQLALQQAPGSAQFLSLLGEAERQLQHAPRALELADEALAADPASGQAHYYRALILLDLQRRAEATGELENLVKSGATVPDVYFVLGGVYLDTGRTDAAIGAIGRGLELDPARVDMRIKLAGAYRARGQLAKADDQLTLAQPASGAMQFSAYYQQLAADLELERGRLRLDQGRLKDATTALVNAVAAKPDNGVAHRFLAEAYLRQGLRAKAAEEAALAEQCGSPVPASLRQAIGSRPAPRGRTP